jgi:hypothetical protein
VVPPEEPPSVLPAERIAVVKAVSEGDSAFECLYLFCDYPLGHVAPGAASMCVPPALAHPPIIRPPIHPPIPSLRRRPAAAPCPCARPPTPPPSPRPLPCVPSRAVRWVPHHPPPLPCTLLLRCVLASALKRVIVCARPPPACLWTQLLVRAPCGGAPALLYSRLLASYGTFPVYMVMPDRSTLKRTTNELLQLVGGAPEGLPSATGGSSGASGGSGAASGPPLPASVGAWTVRDVRSAGQRWVGDGAARVCMWSSVTWAGAHLGVSPCWSVRTSVGGG